MKKRSFVFAFLLLAAATNVFAQNKDLAITGSITGVKISGLGKWFLVDPMNEWAGRRYERSETYFDIAFRLTYCNRGIENLIIPLRKVFPNQMTKLLFLDLPSASSGPVRTVAGKVRETRGPSFDERFVDDLKKVSLPRGFVIIEPETCYESVDSMLLDSGFKVDVQAREINKLDVEFARPEHPYFKLQYGFSMKDSLPVAHAKARWRKFGKLVTSSDGDFFFETDVIINKLPD